MTEVEALAGASYSHEVAVEFLAGLPDPYRVRPEDADRYVYLLRRSTRDHGWSLDRELADYLTRDTDYSQVYPPATVLSERLEAIPDVVVVRYGQLKKSLGGLREAATGIDGLAALLRAGLDLAEAEAEHHLCINCGLPTAPIRSALGVTGYTHDRWRGGWEGARCPGSITGAEPVQKPARVLAEVAAKRAMVDALLAEKHGRTANGFVCAVALDFPEPCDCGRDARVAGLLRLIAAPYQEETDRG